MLKRSGKHGVVCYSVVLVVSAGTSLLGALCEHLAGQSSLRQAHSVLGPQLPLMIFSFSFLVLIECRVSFMLSKHSTTEPHPSLLHIANNDEPPLSPRVIVIDSVCVCFSVF